MAPIASNRLPTKFTMRSGMNSAAMEQNAVAAIGNAQVAPMGSGALLAK